MLSVAIVYSHIFIWFFFLFVRIFIEHILHRWAKACLPNGFPFVCAWQLSGFTMRHIYFLLPRSGRTSYWLACHFFFYPHCDSLIVLNSFPPFHLFLIKFVAAVFRPTFLCRLFIVQCSCAPLRFHCAKFVSTTSLYKTLDQSIIIYLWRQLTIFAFVLTIYSKFIDF